MKLKYQGGGWFRDAAVPKGERAEMLHGDEALAHLEGLLERLSTRLEHSTCANLYNWPEFEALQAHLGRKVRP